MSRMRRGITLLSSVASSRVILEEITLLWVTTKVEIRDLTMSNVHQI